MFDGVRLAGFKSMANAFLLAELLTPLEFVFQEQSYSSIHSGRSLAWDHVRGDIDHPCGVAIPEAIGGRRSLRDPLNIIKHSKTS